MNLVCIICWVDCNLTRALCSDFSVNPILVLIFCDFPWNISICWGCKVYIEPSWQGVDWIEVMGLWNIYCCLWFIKVLISYLLLKFFSKKFFPHTFCLLKRDCQIKKIFQFSFSCLSQNMGLLEIIWFVLRTKNVCLKVKAAAGTGVGPNFE